MARADGGRIAARGFQYQYLRTLEALLAVTPESQVVACRIEGPGEALSPADVDSVDFDLVDAEGRSLVAVQVKSAAAGREVSAPQALAVLVHLVSTYESQRYELITSAAPDANCSMLAEVLARRTGDSEGLRADLDPIFVRAPAARRRLEALTPEQWERLRHARITFDPRDDAELREELNRELRRQRGQDGRGLSQRSGSLVMGFLVAEVLRRAADTTQAYWSVEEFRRRLLVDDDVLCRALGRQDFGIVFGPVPNVPDIAQPELLDQVSKVLAEPGKDASKVPVCVVSGLSGIGKSSLAAAYIAAEAFRYDLVVWLDAATEEALIASYERLLAHLAGSVGASEAGDPVLVRERVQAALQELPGPWLLVFDDATPETVAPWLPRRGRGSVLVTSVSRTWRGVRGRVEVGPMTPEQALQLLTLRLELNQEQARLHNGALLDLSDALDYWPLAIELAAGYVMTCEVKLDRLDGYRSTLLSTALDDQLSVPPGYPRTLVAAVLLSVKRLRDNARGRTGLLQQTFQVLGVLCFLAPHRAPVHLAMACAFVLPEEVFSSDVRALIHEEESHFREIIRELAGVSFVRYAEPLPDRKVPFVGSDDTVSMNAVLQSILRREFEFNTDLHNVLPDTAYHTDRWLVEAINNGEAERAWELAQHASALLGHIERIRAIHNHTAMLAGNLAGFHGSHGQYATAIRLLELELRYLGQCEKSDMLLTCQARIQLSHMNQLTSRGSSTDRNVAELAEVLPYLTDLAAGAPEVAVNLATEALGILQMQCHWAPSHEALRGLLGDFNSLISRLPPTEISRAIQAAISAGALLQAGRAEEAEKEAAVALSSADDPWAIFVPEAHRLLIEALAVQEKWEEASAEFTRFLPYVGPRTLYGFSINHLVNNVGSRCALRWVLTGEQSPLDLLLRLVNDIGIGLDEFANDDFERARFILLRAVCAASQAASDASRSDDFLGLIRQLTEMTFSDDLEQAKVWEMIYSALLPRMISSVGNTIHEKNQLQGDAMISAFADDPEAALMLDEVLAEARTHASFLLSADPVLAAFNFNSMMDFLSPSGRWFTGAMPILLLQPDRLLGATSTVDGSSIELQMHRVCSSGFRRMLPFQNTIPRPKGLVLEQDGSNIALRDGCGAVLAQVSVEVPITWREAARQRESALILYGFAFELHNPAASGRLLSSPEAFFESLKQATESGLVAAAVVSVKLSSMVVSTRPRQQQRRTTRRSRRGR